MQTRAKIINGIFSTCQKGQQNIPLLATKMHIKKAMEYSLSGMTQASKTDSIIFSMNSMPAKRHWINSKIGINRPHHPSLPLPPLPSFPLPLSPEKKTRGVPSVS